MILTDTGPLVALIDRNDAHHIQCRNLLPYLSPPLVVTWPCFAEAMYLLGKAGAWTFHKHLWSYVARHAIRFHAIDGLEENRMAALMEQYRDSPMDLADASVVAAAETLRVRQVFTLDSHFRYYRINNSDVFELTP